MAKQKLQQETDPTTLTHAREAVRFGTQLIDTWDKGARTRLNQIQEYEETYFGKVRPRTSGRSNFPVPVLSRYVDEVKSRLDESPDLKYENQASPARRLVGQKAQAVVRDLKKPSKGNWNKYDRNSRHLAIFAGYNAVDLYSETEDGDFKLNFSPIDHNEFVFEMGGGNDLEQHSGVGRFPIFRTKGELLSRAKSGVYMEQTVHDLVAKYNSSDFKKHDEYFANKNHRYKALGIDIDNNDYMGQQVFALAQLQITIDFGDGPERYLVTFDYGSGIPVRFKPLRDVFPSGRYSIDLWQTHEDQSNVMCKSIVDDIYPFSEGIRLKVNQLFDNHTQRIYGQTGYDPNFVPDAGQLPWKQASQLTRMKSYGGKPISQGLYQFKTEDMTSSTLDFVKWMDEFLTSVVGINPNDVSDEVAKVGILFGQLQKTSARLGIYNKSFREMWERHGVRALWEMKEFLTESVAVKIIGTKGAEWHDFKGSDIEDPDDFEVSAEGSNVELEMSENRKKMQQNAFTLVLGDPDMKKELNPRKTVEKILKIGEYPEDEIRALMDVSNYGNEDMLARADEACEMILKKSESFELTHVHRDTKESVGENDPLATPVWDKAWKPKIYPGADIAFVQYVLQFAQDLDESEDKAKRLLLAYGRAHKQIVMRNMANKGVGELAQKGIPPSAIKTPLPPGAAPGTPAGPTPAAPAMGPRQPSPQVHAKVAARGKKPLGHMPIPTLPGRAPTR